MVNGVVMLTTLHSLAKTSLTASHTALISTELNSSHLAARSLNALKSVFSIVLFLCDWPGVVLMTGSVSGKSEHFINPVSVTHASESGQGGQHNVALSSSLRVSDRPVLVTVLQ